MLQFLGEDTPVLDEYFNRAQRAEGEARGDVGERQALFGGAGYGQARCQAPRHVGQELLALVRRRGVEVQAVRVASRSHPKTEEAQEM